MKKFLFISLAILFVSCSNISLETEPVVVKSIMSGEVLAPGDSFQLSFENMGDSINSNPTSALVKIVYNRNNSRNLLDVDAIELNINVKENPVTTLKIDDFIDGVYNMSVSVYENESLITEYKSEFIVYSGSLSGEITGVYPSSDLYVNSKTILDSKIYHGDSIDPYLVWSYEGDIIEEGYLSNGLNRIVWDSSDNSGFINLRLDIFAYKLESKNISSKIFLDYSFIVSPLGSELYDEIQLSPFYKSLFFNGSYIDELNKYKENIIYNEMEPINIENYYGMRLGSSNGFSTSESIFPKDPETNDFLSFSVILNFMPLNLENGDILYSIDQSHFFNLFVEDGLLKSSYGYGETESKSLSIYELDVKKETKLIINFVKTEQGYSLTFYIDEKLVKTSSWVFDKSFSSEEIDDIFMMGESTGDTEFSYIANLFQVYYKNVNGVNDIYSNHIKDALGDEYNIILSEGFNSIYVPEEVEGSATIDGEILYMSPDSIIKYIDLLPLKDDYTINLNINNSSYLLGFENENGIVLEKTLTGNVEINRKDGTLFLGKEVIPNWSEDNTTFFIKSLELELQLDSIVVLSREFTIEAE